MLQFWTNRFGDLSRAREPAQGIAGDPGILDYSDVKRFVPGVPWPLRPIDKLRASGPTRSGRRAPHRAARGAKKNTRLHIKGAFSRF